MTDLEHRELRRCLRYLQSVPGDDARVQIVRDILDSLIYTHEQFEQKQTALAGTRTVRA